ncbi:Manganese transport system membrane protein mntB [Actinomyces bovis]|uniref:Manganese transport system membrane protein mntB n=1 Tax=Actinomyces bovis TaxID=1658 RepID=A0ABY1VQB1_9ACTO|nr:metal ABC transporter permease [Actinomyces bovis]SPT54316.1 Manganese transport system membrane protein mntB [Actinomyces bovis]VEG56321.1 Manganese transport system membrane protein mntB [Actinomyces israelii]
MSILAEVLAAPGALEALAAPNLVSPGDFLESYTYRTMAVGTTAVGTTAGALGAFLYLHKQSLVSDVIGHSAALGVTGAFIVATALLGIDGRSMLVLTIGSVIASTAAVLLANWIARNSRVGVDAAMATCLALFYGGGLVLFRVIVHSKLRNRGGIDKYMFGNAATLSNNDLVTIAALGALALALMLVFWKELKVYTFDPVLAATSGFSPRILSPLLLGTATLAIVIGIKAVGLILMIAFAIMPAAGARQWTGHLWSMVGLSAAFGGLGGLGGSYLAVNLGKVPTGPVVVIVLFVVLTVSLLAAPERSVLQRRRAQAEQRRRLLAETEVGSCLS